VRLLGDLVALQSHGGAVEGTPRDAQLQPSASQMGATSSSPGRPAAAAAAEPRTAFGHLFDLCAGCDASDGATTGQEAAACEESAASLAARGANAGLRPPARIPDRGALLRIAVPSLLAQVRRALAAYVGAERHAAAAPDGAVPVLVPVHCVDEVRFVLARLKAFCADDAALCAASAVLPSDRARDACRLAGPRGYAMALLPELALLAGTSDARVAKEIRDVLQGLASALGF